MLSQLEYVPISICIADTPVQSFVYHSHWYWTIKGVGHDDVIKWKHFPRDWPFVRGITGEFPSQSQRRGALMFSLICAWTNGWTNNRDAGDLRRHRTYYDVTGLPVPTPTFTDTTVSLDVNITHITHISKKQAEAWWRASIWRSHRKVVIKQCSNHNNIIDIQNRLLYSKVVYPAIIVLFSCLMEVNHGVRTGPDYPFR